MSEYKRKKVRKIHRRKPKKAIKYDNDIKMRSTKHHDNSDDNESIKVVRGAKLRHKHFTKIVLITIATISIVCIVLSFLLPVSLYENLVNTFALLGNGSYPIDLSGSQVLNVVSNGSYYYILTDSSISAYSNAGKEIFSELHGYSSPMLSVSETRAVVYDQSGNSLSIFNLGGLIKTMETENSIVSASISRSGALAVVTHSDDYASALKVYDKSLNGQYQWNSSQDIITNAIISPNGKKVAVSTINTASGDFVSKLLILNFDSADPTFTLDIENKPILSLYNSGSGFSVITSDKYRCVNWSEYSTNEISSSGEINIVRRYGKYTLLLFNRANDRSDNTVVLVSNKGEKISEFKINSIISDIQYRGGRIYYISDTTVSILDKNGSLLKNGNCEYGCNRFAVIGSNSLAAVTDNEILRIDIKES